MPHSLNGLGTGAGDSIPQPSGLSRAGRRSAPAPSEARRMPPTRPSAEQPHDPGQPEQADGWIWLALTVHTQLRPARQVAADARLPWERPDPAATVTLTGCAAGFRGCCGYWACRLLRRNHLDAPQAGQRASLRTCHPLSGR
jgi:hypothetical protein